MAGRGRRTGGRYSGMRGNRRKGMRSAGAGDTCSGFSQSKPAVITGMGDSIDSNRKEHKDLK